MDVVRVACLLGVHLRRILTDHKVSGNLEEKIL